MLSERDVQYDERSASTVMMASGGYPEKYKEGTQIFNLNAITDSVVFHAGKTPDGPVVDIQVW